MINTVRNTVLSVLNKNNYGYLSPSDFNLFAKQAQLDIFESYFSQYNYQINKENARQSGTGIADLAKSIEESMDLFSMTDGLFLDALGTAGSYQMPSTTTTGSDYYFINKVLVYKDIITSGATDGPNPPTANELVDSTKDFNALGIVAGDIVAIQTDTTGVQYTTVVSINVAGDTITLSGSILDLSPLSYTIIKAGTQQNEAEKVTHSKITMLNNSIYTAPTATYPAYTSQETLLQVSPDAITSAGRVVAQYFRYPKDPNWTYIELTNGEPIFNQSDAQYQDFEIPLDDENNLTMKILQYAGVSIREVAVNEFANGEETKENQQEG
jgi:hypothetical protein